MWMDDIDGRRHYRKRTGLEGGIAEKEKQQTQSHSTLHVMKTGTVNYQVCNGIEMNYPTEYLLLRTNRTTPRDKGGEC